MDMAGYVPCINKLMAYYFSNETPTSSNVNGKAPGHDLPPGNPVKTSPQALHRSNDLSGTAMSVNDIV